MDLSLCRTAFPSLAQTLEDGRPLVYLDSPGGSQVPESVIAAMADYYRHHNANAHGAFVTSQATDAVIAEARACGAAFLGASSPDTISFGANMTTLNFALSHAIAPRLEEGDEVIVTDLDHEANISPWRRLQGRGIGVRRVPLTPEGRLDMQQFATLINSRTRLVAVGYASNALGTVNDLAQIRQWTHAVGAWLIVDAVHYAPHGPIDVEHLDPDFLLCSAYKFFGPHLGMLYAKPGRLGALDPDRVAPQNPNPPYRIETGTLNHAALAGFIAAIHFIANFATQSGPLRVRLVQAMQTIASYEHDLATQLYDGLQRIPGIHVWGPPMRQPRTPTLSFTVAKMASPQVAGALGTQGILVWDGDFYAPQVVDHFGLRHHGGLVRIGLAPYSAPPDLERALEALHTVVSHGG